MQDITPQIPDNLNQLDAYGGGKFKVSGRTHETSIVIAPEFLREISASEINELKTEDFNIIIENKDKIEFLIVGTGETSDFLSVEYEKILKSNGIIVEYMNSSAAARTYNILLSEGRKFAAIIIVV